jgi:hypothetical protein
MCALYIISVRTYTNFENVFIHHRSRFFLVKISADDFLVSWTVVQGVYSRTPKFDGSNYYILSVENVAKLVKSSSAGLWINVQVTTK